MKIIITFFIALAFISCNKNQSTSQTKSDNKEVNQQNNSTEKTINEGQQKENSNSDGIKILEFNKSDLPSDIKYKGNIVAGAKWSDKNGDNYVIITETDIKNYTHDGNDVISKEILSYCYSVTGNKSQLVWDIVDFIKDCPLDMRVEYIPNSLSITDLNNNGIGESTFLYALGCKGDVSPDDLKLMMHEGNSKYALRGETKIEYEVDGKTFSDGGDYKPDTSFNSAPAGFLDYAKQQWNKFYIQKL